MIDLLDLTADPNDPRNVKGHVPRSVAGHYQRHGLVADSGDWYHHPKGAFALAPMSLNSHSEKYGSRRKRLTLVGSKD